MHVACAAAIPAPRRANGDRLGLAGVDLGAPGNHRWIPYGIRVDHSEDTQSAVAAVDRPEAPDVLYHYTTAAGLQGILDSGSMWATELRFLNDERELQFGIDILVSELRRQVAVRDSRPSLLKIIDVLSVHRLLRHYFVTCFCEQGDLLSQWRGYASPGGYALGLSVQDCKFPEWAVGFFPVVYDVSAAQAEVREWVGATAERFLRVFDERLDSALREDSAAPALAPLLEEFGRDKLDEMEAISATLKHPSFSEEREWRILTESHPQATADREVRFRAGVLGPTPYVSIPLARDGQALPIREIVIGPGPNAKARSEAVRMLLWKHRLLDVSVISSSIPYRP